MILLSTMKMLLSNKMNIAIIGAGLTGLTWARYLSEKKYNITIFESNNFIGGNCSDYLDDSTKVYVHKFGPHIFHTNKEHVWKFINRFSQFNNYRHRVLAKTIKGDFFIPRPSNCTMNENEIIELFFKVYSIKQWGKSWDELPDYVKTRVPRKREIESDQYFLNAYQGIPIDGYSSMLKKISNHPNIKIILNRCITHQSPELSSYNTIIVTGSIDHFFNYCFGELPYRSARFVHYKNSNTGKRGINTSWKYIINDCTFNNSYTRTWDNKTWLNGNNFESETIISEEYPIEYQLNKSMVRTHPIMEQKNIELYQRYLTYSKSYSKKLIFSGRLGKYKYLNMDEVIDEVLTEFNNIKGNI